MKNDRKKADCFKDIDEALNGQNKNSKEKSALTFSESFKKALVSAGGIGSFKTKTHHKIPREPQDDNKQVLIVNISSEEDEDICKSKTLSD